MPPYQDFGGTLTVPDLISIARQYSMLRRWALEQCRRDRLYELLDGPGEAERLKQQRKRFMKLAREARE
jgi:hypothetical protein